MKVSFNPSWAPKWSIDVDKIIKGKKTFMLRDVEKLSPLTESKGKGWNGVIQIWFLNGKFTTLAFRYEEREQGYAVYKYIEEYLNGLKGKRIFSSEDKEIKMKNFYQECISDGVTDLSTTGRKEKVKLVLQKHFDSAFIANIGSVEAFFEEAKSLVEADERKKEDFEMVGLKFKEKTELDNMTKYSELFGREKRVAMLNDMFVVFSKKAEDARKAEQTLISIGVGQQRKEHDWAIHGGMAAGIAGTAAGVAVAMDIQEKNARIREENRNVLNLTAQAAAGISSSAYDFERQAAAANAEMQEAKAKVVEEMPGDVIFEEIDVFNETCDISKTGAFTISATLMLKDCSKKIRVCDEFDGVYDGTVAADLYQNNEKVGTALLVLPLYGLEDLCDVKGICTSGAKEDVPYEIKFRAHKMWKMEK